MAFTAYRTWVDGETPSETLFNQQIRDNGLIIKTSINDDGTLSVLQTGRMTSDKTYTTDTTLADLTGLSFAIAASEVWMFFAAIHFVSPTAADIKFDSTLPSGAAGRHGLLGARNEITHGSRTLGTVVDVSTIDSTDMFAIYTGTVVNSTTAGTVQVQAAQNSSSGTTTVYTNSGITAIQIV